MRICVYCKETWPCNGTANSGRDWRGAPELLDPMRQWIAENCPTSDDKFVFIDIDGAARSYLKDQYGYVWLVEFKTHGATINGATRMTLRAMDEGRTKGILRLTQSADIPSWLHHWPESCNGCGLPGTPKVSDWIHVNDTIVTPQELVEILTHETEPPNQITWRTDA